MNLKKVFLFVFFIVTSLSFSLSFKEISESKSEKNYSYNIKLPLIDIPTNDYQKDFNSSMLAMKEKRIHSILEELKELNDLTFALETQVTYELFQSEIGIDSILVTNYIYSGGAHGSTFLSVFNLDSKTGESIPLNKIISPEGIEYITKTIQEEINMNLNEKYFNNATVILDDSYIYFDKDMLEVIFPQYSIAPYSSGMPKFTFNLKDLKKFLLIN